MYMQEKGRVYNIYIACMLKNGRINKKWIKEKQGYLSEDKTGCKNCRSKVNYQKRKRKKDLSNTPCFVDLTLELLNILHNYT